MTTLPGKPWYASKTIWVAIVSILVAAYNTASGYFKVPAIPEFVFAILGFLGIYARTTTNTVIK